MSKGKRWLIVGVVLLVAGLFLYLISMALIPQGYSGDEAPAGPPNEMPAAPEQSVVVPMIGAISGLIGAMAGLITAVAGLIAVLRKKSAVSAG